MKCKYFASFIVFIALFALNYLIHGVLLKGMYHQTASVWRPEADIKHLMWHMWLGYLIFAPIFVCIYSKGYEEGKGRIGQGFRYGFWMGSLLSVMQGLILYTILPIPCKLAVYWILSGIAKYTCLGTVLGLAYKKE